MNRKRMRAACGGLAAALAAGTMSDVARAGGFYVPQQGSTGVGLSTAGGAALASDASTAFFNPAGMTRLPGATVKVGVDFLVPRIRINNQGSTAATLGTASAPLAFAGGSGDAGELTPIPTLYYARPLLGRDLWLGLAINAPFGLSLDYGRNWFGRYDSIETKVLTLNISPSLAYRLSPSWSIGGGLDIQYGKGRLTYALPDPLNPGGPTVATDGLARLNGDDTAVGFNVGTLFDVVAGTRIGVHYRSRITHDFKGDATVSGLTGPLAAGNGTVGAVARVKLPDIVSVAIAHELTPSWTLLAEAQWFKWGVFDELRVKFANGQPDEVRPQGFRNSWAIAAGAEYRLSSHWTVRGGVRFDRTPTVDTFRNSSIPDSDLRWIGLGASYRASDRVTFEAGYGYTDFKSANINLNSTFYAGTPVAAAVNTRGRTDNTLHTIAVSMRYQF